MSELVELPSTSVGAKIAGFAGKVLPPVAAIMSFAADPLAHGGLENPDMMIQWSWNRLKNWRFPDLWRWINDVRTLDMYKWIIPTLGTTIAIGMGEKLIEQYAGIKIPPTIKAVSSTIKKTGAASVAGGLTGALVWMPGMYNPAYQPYAEPGAEPGYTPLPNLGYSY